MLILFLLFFLQTWVFAQTFTISGHVKDSATGEYLIGTTIYIKELQKGTTSNNYGFYSLKVEEGTYTIIVSFIGYKTFEKKIKVDRNLTLNVELAPSSIQVEEVVIESERADKNIRETQMGKASIDMEKVKSLPVLFGETDVLKAIQLIPGVKASVEGFVGFYVRGGNADQNLIILDESNVYNPGHLGGIFSVFLPEAINNFTLWKGIIPARFGGRLSSVLDITLREGNTKKYSISGGIGTITSYILLEGPIKKDTASFIVSLRRTYLDIFMKHFIKKTSPFYGTTYYFTDATAKMNWKVNSKNHLFLSLYWGRDIFDYVKSDFNFKANMPWGNLTSTFRWNHLFSTELFSNFTINFSHYLFGFRSQTEDFTAKYESDIKDFSIKGDLTWNAHALHTLRFGFQAIYHVLLPDRLNVRVGESTVTSGIKYQGLENALYIEDEWDLSPQLSINYGARLPYFIFLGPFTRYKKSKEGNTLDSTTYKDWEIIKDYYYLEPRISARYLLRYDLSIKGGFARINQFIHQASYSGTVLPMDIWILSSELLKPQNGWQASLGIFKNFLNNSYETSIEAYYRKMNNVVEYGPNDVPENRIKNNPDNVLIQGRGYAYGVELFINKKAGKFQGWIGYTYSRTFRIFELINNGEPFPARHDRIHDLSIALSYNISNRLKFATDFVFYTGDAVTLPIAIYVLQGEILYEYSKKNSLRLPNYHRLDFSLSLRNKPHKKFYSEFILSVYNVYSRYNPFFLFLEKEGDLKYGYVKITPKIISLFPILPSLSWKFKF